MLHKAKRSSFHEINSLKGFACSLLLELFPFGIMINPEMRIMGAGEKLVQIWRSQDPFLNQPVHCFFRMRRPKGVSFSWKNVLINIVK